jgi:hypothetical protein
MKMLMKMIVIVSLMILDTLIQMNIMINIHIDMIIMQMEIWGMKIMVIVMMSSRM